MRFWPPSEGGHASCATSRTVAWLLVVPISDAEMRFASSHGPSTLEEQLDRHQIDIFDPDRPSVV